MHISEPTLALLDALPLECDGLTRLISILLTRDGVDFQCYVGPVCMDSGRIGLHYWIGFSDGHILDLRARLWLGDTAPHGYFNPTSAQVYDGEPIKFSQVYSSLMVNILTGRTVEDFPPVFTDTP